MALGQIPGKALRAYYRLENVSDSSGNGNTLTNNNSVGFNTGRYSNAADFGTTGTNKGLTINSNIFSALNPSRFFISFWFKLENVTHNTNATFFVCRSTEASTDGFQISCFYSVSGSDLTLTARRLRTGSPNSIDISVTLTINYKWNYCYVFHDSVANEFRLLVQPKDAVRSSIGNSSAAANRSSVTSEGVLTSIGNNRTLTISIRGKMDEVIIDENFYPVLANRNERFKYYTHSVGKFVL
jgi:hypothetical protein